MNDNWNANIYSQFLDLRTRPARDLLSAIPDSFSPKIIYDLGCGPGNSSILLKARWPHAQVIGVDSSDDMLKTAKSSYPDIQFIKEDIVNFEPCDAVDCLFANASLQWLDHHEKLIPKLLDFLVPGGFFAIQMPNNFHSPTHQVTIDILKKNIFWQAYLPNLRYDKLTEPLYNLAWYYNLLANSKIHLQLWQTEYYQEMASYQDIFAWVKGTGLREVLAKMDITTQNEFAEEYINAIAKAYPLEKNNKILMPFKRLFILICK